MPHANEPERYKRIVGQIEAMKATTLTEYPGSAARPTTAAAVRAYGKTDADVFGNNLLEAIQFVFSCTTLSRKDALDREVLATHKSHGAAPGQKWDPAKVDRIDCAMFRQVVGEAQKADLAIMLDPDKCTP